MKDAENLKFTVNKMKVYVGCTNTDEANNIHMRMYNTYKHTVL